LGGFGLVVCLPVTASGSDREIKISCLFIPPSELVSSRQAVEGLFLPVSISPRGDVIDLGHPTFLNSGTPKLDG